MKHTNSIRKALGIAADFAPLGMVDVSKTLDAIDAERAELLAALEEYKRGDLLSDCRIILERAGHPQLSKGLQELETIARDAIAKATE